MTPIPIEEHRVSDAVIGPVAAVRLVTTRAARSGEPA